MSLTRHTILPGFRWTLAFTILYLSLIVLIPLSALFLKASSASWHDIWAAVSSPRVVAAYKLSFGASLAAAGINVVFGLLVAWVLVRYKFPGRSVVDALVDLPFALPTAVAGITLTALYAPNGWIGKLLDPQGINALKAIGLLGEHDRAIAYTPLGITLALTFIGLPFVVRTVQPVLQDLDAEVEEAAASLGANRWQTFWFVVLPSLTPALLTGFTLAFARALGEYGSVVFIAGNNPLRTEIVPLLIVTRLEEYDFTGATAIATLMLIVSFVLLLIVNLLQWWSARRYVA